MRKQYDASISLYDRNNVFMCILMDIEFRKIKEEERRDYFLKNHLEFPFHSELLNYLIDDYLLDNRLVIEFSDSYIESYDLFLIRNERSLKNKQEVMSRLIYFFKKENTSLNAIINKINKWKIIQDNELNYQLEDTMEKNNNKIGTDFNTTKISIEMIFGEIPERIYIKTYFK